MLPTIMSQMGMTTESILGSEAGRRKGDHNQTGDGHSGTTNEQAGAEGADDVPGMKKFLFSIEYIF
jgi:hypothetical protein